MTKTFYIVFSFFVLCLSNCVLGENGDTLSIDALLERCKQSLSWTDSMSIDVHMDIRTTEEDVVYPHLTKDYIFRRDGERVEWLGKIISYDDKGNVGENSFEKKMIGTGDRFLEVSSLFGEKPTYPALMRLEHKEHQENRLDSAETCGPLIGRGAGLDRKTVIDVLADSHNVSMSKHLEKINGMLCRRLRADTKYGEVTVWIAPDKSYSAVKWTIRKKPEQYPGPLKIRDVLDAYEIMDLAHINGFFVPKVATYTFRIEDVNGYVITNNYKYKVDDIDLDPDFELLGAFKIDLPDGTPVKIMEHPAVMYKWQDGKLVPDVDKYVIEQIDKMDEEIVAEGGVPDGLATAKKTEAAPNQPASIAETQVTTKEAQGENILSESRPFPMLVFVLIGLSIIAIIVWRVFLLKGKK